MSDGPFPQDEQLLDETTVVKGLADSQENTTITVELRRKEALPDAAEWPISYQELCERYGAAEDDAQAVVDYATARGLIEVERNLGKRIVVLEGKRGDVERVFPAEVRVAEREGETFRKIVGGNSVAPLLAERVLSVVGLDDEPILEPHIALSSPVAERASIWPIDVARHYGFDLGGGEGAIIALLEFGGGYVEEDLRASFEGQGLGSIPDVECLVVGAGTNTPGQTKPHREVALDLQVAATVAPRAAFRIYFASSSTQDILACIVEAVHARPRPTVISMSWGAKECAWQSAHAAFGRRLQEAAALGICFFASSGDSGSGRNQRVPEYPSTDPHATSCGGTQMARPGDFQSEEIVWSDGGSKATGGGFSPSTPIPAFQRVVRSGDGRDTADLRGVPDIAGYACMNPGYRIFVEGVSDSAGGTSAVAPLYAAFVANIVGSGTLVHLNEMLYRNHTAFLDIVTGDSKLSSGVGVSAGPGWDACTGLGRAKGDHLAEVLRSAVIARKS